MSAADTDAEATHAGLSEVLARISDAAQRSRRQPEEVALIAVSKTFGPEHIRPVLAAGHRLFGENRVQEAQGKWPELRTEYADVSLLLKQTQR